MARAAKKSVVSVVAAPEVDVVREEELANIVATRKALKDLAATKRATEKRLEIQEADVIKRLRAGAKVEGKFVAIVEMVKGRISVSWKDVAMKFAVRLGLNPAAVEMEERAEKEKELVEEPTLLITGNAVEQYVGDAVGK